MISLLFGVLSGKWHAHMAPDILYSMTPELNGLALKLTGSSRSLQEITSVDISFLS
jgi:hypothetical protein